MAVKKDFNAAMARAISEKKASGGLQDILKRIEAAANEVAKGVRRGTSLTVAANLIDEDSGKIVAELKAKGFKVEYVSDWRDDDYYSIEW